MAPRAVDSKARARQLAQIDRSYSFWLGRRGLALIVEMAHLNGFVSRSAFLYFDLLICEINPGRRGWLSDAEISEASDQSRLRRFAVELEPLWQESRCPRCLGLATGGRFCRLHFQEAVATGSAVA